MADNVSSVQLDVRDHLLVLLRRKWMVMGAIALCVSLAAAASYLQTPLYSSTAKVLIQRASSSSIFDPAGQRMNPDLVAEIETQFFNGEAVRAAASQKLGYRAAVTATAGGRGSVLQITATESSPARAADIANAYANAYVETRRTSTVDDFVATGAAAQAKIADIDRQLQELDAQELAANGGVPTTANQSKGVVSEQRAALQASKEALRKSFDQVTVSSEIARGGGPQMLLPATASSSPVSPNLKKDVLVGLLVGLLIGVAGAFLIDFLDDSIKSRNDVEAATDDLPILAVIPHLTDWRNRSEAHLASIEQPSSPTAEAYRTLRTSVQFAGLERSIHTLQVTSPRAQDGKSTTAANLAVALARAGLRVVLVDCDLRRPRLHQFLGLTNTVGFTSVLLGETSLDDALQSMPGMPTLQVLASGPSPPNPSELLSGRRAADLVDSLKEGSDIVVIDTPPVLPVSDAMVVSDLMDVVIMVVAAGSTTKKEAHRACELLRQVDAPLVGAVMNSGPGQSGYGYGYGYDSGYGYAYGTSSRRKGAARLFGAKKSRASARAASPAESISSD